MQPTVTDGVAWSVCVCYDCEPCKNCWLDQDAV